VKRNELNDSILLIDKQAGETSYRTVDNLKRLLSIKKIGHSGTLDKFASGLLVVCTGRATRLTRYFLENDKRYLGEVQLGISTDTDDLEGHIIRRETPEEIDEISIKETAKSFLGKFYQVPPIYSAVKINGVRSSDLARQGKRADLKAREVKVYSIDVLNFDKNKLRFLIDVTSSKGTYIRSLARDIGEKLGTAAYLRSLRRIESGAFLINNAVTLNEIKDYLNGIETNNNFVIKPVDALQKYSTIVVTDRAKEMVLNGAFFKKNDILRIREKDQDRFLILDDKENLIAIADIKIDVWQIKYLNVFTTPLQKFE